MIGGMSGVEQDIIPYGLYTGIRSHLRGLNIIGLKRKGMDSKKIKQLKNIYSIIFDTKNPLTINLKKINDISNDEYEEIKKFILSKSIRGICTPKYV